MVFFIQKAAARPGGCFSEDKAECLFAVFLLIAALLVLLVVAVVLLLVLILIAVVLLVLLVFTILHIARISFRDLVRLYCGREEQKVYTDFSKNKKMWLTKPERAGILNQQNKEGAHPPHLQPQAKRSTTLLPDRRFRWFVVARMPSGIRVL